MKKLVFFFLLPFLGFAQKNIFLHIDPVFNNQAFIPQTVYMGNNGQNVALDYLKYYLADVTITHDGGQVLDLTQTVYLMDDASHTIYFGAHNVTNIEQINFLIGVPSRLNTQAGSLAQDISTYNATYALSFQSPSMYWGWAAGYMHMIVGGKADGNNDQIPEAYFELHNLGDHNQRSVSFPNVIPTNSNPTQIDLYFNCHVDHWLNGINLATVGVLHDETGINIQVMQNVETKAVFDQPATAGVAVVNQAAVQISSQQGAIQCTWVGQHTETEIVLLDQSGRQIRKQTFGNSAGQFSWIGLNPGLYFIQYADHQGKEQSRQVLVF
ncbi:MAG: MbnP family protein [Flavobacteriia bacterium]